jgi:hypothetical protein
MLSIPKLQKVKHARVTFTFGKKGVLNVPYRRIYLKNDTNSTLLFFESCDKCLELIYYI